MLFYVFSGLYIATVLFMYLSANTPRASGGDFLGDELGLYMLACMALIFGLLMLVTGFLKIKKTLTAAAGAQPALMPIFVVIFALSSSAYVYSEITSSGDAKTDPAVEVR